MKQIDANGLRELTPWALLIPALAAAFASPCEMPPRSQFDINGRGTLLLMPAWNELVVGVKTVQVFPGNSALHKPAVQATYLLSSAVTGEPLVNIDGDELTTRRTAAASALASRALSRTDSRCLLLVGAGRLAFDVACAHAAVRPLERILVWARRADGAVSVAERLAATLGVAAQAVTDLPRAVAQADIISTVTTARDPVLSGRWVRPGTHVDLIGGFTPEMREADDELIGRAELFADMRAAVLREAGDYVSPLRRGLIDATRIRADLFDLSRGASGRRGPEDITVFKSVGLALEDLAAATLAWRRLG